MNARLKALQVARWAAEDARQAAQVARWAAEDAAARREALIADGDPCALCGRPTCQWVELCDDCNDAVQDLADALPLGRA